MNEETCLSLFILWEKSSLGLKWLVNQLIVHKHTQVSHYMRITCLVLCQGQNPDQRCAVVSGTYRFEVVLSVRTCIHFFSSFSFSSSSVGLNYSTTFSRTSFDEKPWLLPTPWPGHQLIFPERPLQTWNVLQELGLLFSSHQEVKISSLSLTSLYLSIFSCTEKKSTHPPTGAIAKR